MSKVQSNRFIKNKSGINSSCGADEMGEAWAIYARGRRPGGSAAAARVGRPAALAASDASYCGRPRLSGEGSKSNHTRLLITYYFEKITIEHT